MGISRCISFSNIRNPTEYLRPEDTYSPLLHRINEVIGYRAVHPTNPIPPPIEVLTKYSYPPEELVKGSEKAQKKLIEVFNVKKGQVSCCKCLTIVPPRSLAKRKKVDEVKPVSGLDIEALLLRGKTSGESSAPPESKRQKLTGEIGFDDPAKDFKKLIDNEENSWKPGSSQSNKCYLLYSLQRNGEND